MSSQNKVWILDGFQDCVIVTCQIVMVLDDMKPALLGESNRYTRFRYYDLHCWRPSEEQFFLYSIGNRNGNTHVARVRDGAQSAPYEADISDFEVRIANFLCVLGASAVNPGLPSFRCAFVTLGLGDEASQDAVMTRGMRTYCH